MFSLSSNHFFLAMNGRSIFISLVLVHKGKVHLPLLSPDPFLPPVPYYLHNGYGLPGLLDLPIVSQCSWELQAMKKERNTTLVIPRRLPPSTDGLSFLKMFVSLIVS